MAVKFKDPLAARACVLKFNSTSSFPAHIFAFCPLMVQSRRTSKADDPSPFTPSHLDRFFAQRQISASLFEGRLKFKKSGAGTGAGDEEEEAQEEKARLEKFREYLEKEEGATE
jgi:hypothetical protein